jgi:O-antigen ligase
LNEALTSQASIRSLSWPRLAALLGAGGALGLGLGELTFVRPPLSLAGATVLVLLAAAIFTRVLGARVGLLALLVTTCLIDRFTYPLGRVDIRAEQLAALIGLGATGFWIVSRRSGWNLLRPNLSELLLGLWLALSLVSSLAFSPDTSRSVKAVALLLISSLGFLLPRRLIQGRQDQMDMIVKLFLVAIAAEAAYGTGAFLAHVFGPTVSLNVNPASGHLSAYGTLWEPNVFGAFCAAGAVAWAWLGRRYFGHAWIGIAACLGGTLVSFTRAAWFAAVVVLAISLAGPVRQRASLRQLALGIAGAAVIAIAVFGVEQTSHYYQQVSGTPTTPPASTRGLLGLLSNATDVIGRLDQVTKVLHDLGPSPLLGNGTASYGVRHPVAGQPEQHLANLELAVLNDTGVIGLLTFLAFGVSLAYAAWRRRRDPTVAGLGMATLVIVITNTATETTELMITWLMLGLVLLAVDHASEHPSEA